MRGITMRFGSFCALKDVDFRVERGEIVGLLGENGCGKSTLVKVLAGVNVPDEGGSLWLSGRQVPLPLLPGQFRDLGLSFVHQDLGLARTLTVAENLVFAETASAKSRRTINWRREVRRIEHLLGSYRVNVDPQAPINQLPPVGQALVAIVRAAEELKAYRERADVPQSILFLDEPTVFLPENEVEFLFDLVRTIVREGASAVFISHDLGAVRALCDRAVVLRDGELVGEAAIDAVTDRELIDMIVGSASGKLVGRAHRPAGGTGPAAATMCEVDGLRGGRVRGVDLAVRSAEIVGIAGLLGSGAEDIPYLCFGSRRSDSGVLTVGGRRLRLPRMRPFDAVRAGVALVPADRRRDGIAPTLTVAENTTILVNERYTRFGRLQARRLGDLVQRLLEKFDVRPRRPDARLGELSGGNQQRVVLAKWLEIDPRLLLLHEPTQGVDIAARAEIYRLVREAAAGGMATLWVSSDFEELATVCDRVLVMADGVVRAELTGDEVREDAISAAVYYYSTTAASVLSDPGGHE
ncbi:MAG: sugar ABC transporter ATP-binding protein [Micromonosporaceae bacterium]|nr:sugar ABC transporter ATP-binding protein [Micromonosporaceae bacterium]